jgi:succinate dehydrogenase / fumarate reductase flavoprotein subunit
MSGYPEYMQESLRLVEKTRPERIEKIYPLMSADEKQNILKDWHPDFKAGMKRALKFGPSQGQIMPHEVADILEAHPIIKPGDIDLTHIDYDLDVLIIGAGGAGLTSALLALENGIELDKILIVQKLRIGDSNSKMSEGGINAANGPDDSPALHFLDTMGGGHYANDPDLVEILVKEAPDVIRWHDHAALGLRWLLSETYA